jgi:ketosteroid isomerase-like protein
MKLAGSILFAFTSATVLAAAPASAQSHSPAQRAVAAADRDWEVVFAAKDLDKSVKAVSAEGSMLAPNTPIATGHAAVRELIKNILALPALNFSWHATSVEVAKSGDLAFTSGEYQLSFDAGNGKIESDKGKYVTVWGLEKDGVWRAVRDIFNSDLPAPK